MKKNKGLATRGSASRAPKTELKSKKSKNFRKKMVRKFKPDPSAEIFKRIRSKFMSKKFLDKEGESESENDSEEKIKKIPLKMLHIPKLLIEQSERKVNHSSYRKQFSSFKKIDSVAKFIKECETNFPIDTLEGLSNRLEYNGKSRSNYLKFYKGKQRRAVSIAVDKIKDWNERTKKMPRVRVIKRNMDSSLPLLSTRICKGVDSLISKTKFGRKGVFTDRGHQRAVSLNLKPKPKIQGLITISTKTSKNKDTQRGQQSEEEQSYKINLQERMSQVKTLFGCWVEVNSDFPPETREGASMCKVGHQIYLLGGVNQRMVPNIWKFDPLGMTWSTLNYENESTYFPRFNHSSVAFQNKIYIFGGEKISNRNFYSRSCLNDIRILNPSKPLTIIFRVILIENGEWKTPTQGESYIEERRNHSACSIYQFLLVFGGINQSGQTLNDFWYYNMEVKSWNSASVMRKLPRLSHATMTPVFSNLKSRVLDLFNKKMFEGPQVRA